MLAQVGFGNVAECLTVNGLESAFIEMGMVWNCKRLSGAIGEGSCQLDVAAFLPNDDKAERRQYCYDILAGQDFQLRQ